MLPTTTMTTLLVNNGTRARHQRPLARQTEPGSEIAVGLNRTPTTLQERASALLLCKGERGDANERASERASKQGTTATATTAHTEQRDAPGRRRSLLVLLLRERRGGVERRSENTDAPLAVSLFRYFAPANRSMLARKQPSLSGRMIFFF